NLAKADTIERIMTDVRTLDRNLAEMQEYRDKIMVAAGLTSPYSLTEVGQGGGDLGEAGSTATIQSGISDLELSRDKIANTAESRNTIVGVTSSVAKRAKQVQKDLKYVEAHINEQKARLASTPALWPTRGYLTDSFGMRTHPFTGKRSFHNGLDIATQLGNKVIATADGYVLVREFSSFLGNVILIDHGFGFSTRYGHLASFNIKEGERVKRGQVIGYVGNSGRSTAPHLHYEIIYMGKNQNPMAYILE
ncbi:MAG: M23 family metallopeptidase, partial [bacterium]|nr:M23 family metallopeptidase [bacterium]